VPRSLSSCKKMLLQILARMRGVAARSCVVQLFGSLRA
jgi:hypothetical protein